MGGGILGRRRKRKRKAVKSKAYIKIVDYTAYFAPSAESCKIKYKIKRDMTGPGNIPTVVIKDKNGNEISSKTALEVLGTSQHALNAGTTLIHSWDGKDNKGKYVSPLLSPFSALIYMKRDPSIKSEIKKKIKVVVNDIALWVDAKDGKVFLRTDKKRTVVVATVYIRKSNNTGVVTKIPMAVTFSYKFKGRGTAPAKVSWKQHPKSPATSPDFKKTSKSAVIVAGADRGKAKVYFDPKDVSKADFQLMAAIYADSSGTDRLATKRANITVYGPDTVDFVRETSHKWGYDAYEEIKCIKNGRNFKEFTIPNKDFVSIKKNKTGKVKVEIKNVSSSDVYFKSKDPSICTPKVNKANANPFILEIEAKNKDKHEADIEARFGSTTGPLLARVGVVVLKEVVYKAELFKVKDKTSVKTNLNSAGLTVNDAESAINKAFKMGVAKVDLSGTGRVLDNVAYDTIKNGSVDMEPGKTTDEQKKIIQACVAGAGRTSIIYVHDLRWAFYLAEDVAKDAKKVKIKIYTALKYVTKNSWYNVEDKNGKKGRMYVTNVNRASGELTIRNPGITAAFKTADKAALIWPLGGLSGNPIWAKDIAGSVATLKNVFAHELGHQVANLKDLTEIDNTMHRATHAKQFGLRHRNIKKSYENSREKQWTKIKRS